MYIKNLLVSNRRAIYLTAFASAMVCAAFILYWPSLDSPPVPAPFSSAEPYSPNVGPPWVYGRTDARFTIVLYADFACPHCRAYFPVLKQWIASHPEASWQWHHLPTQATQTDSMRDARHAECAGESGGNEAFWSTVTSIYQGSIQAGPRAPDMESCLNSLRPDAIIQGQAASAAQEGITTTPTLKVIDKTTGRFLFLRGPADGDGLLSATDYLAGPYYASAQQPNPP
jgi:hypothetical protein